MARNHKGTKAQRHKERPHQRIFHSGLSLCLCVFVVPHICHRICENLYFDRSLAAYCANDADSCLGGICVMGGSKPAPSVSSAQYAALIWRRGANISRSIRAVGSGQVFDQRGNILVCKPSSLSSHFRHDGLPLFLGKPGAIDAF